MARLLFNYCYVVKAKIQAEIDDTMMPHKQLCLIIIETNISQAVGGQLFPQDKPVTPRNGQNQTQV